MRCAGAQGKLDALTQWLREQPEVKHVYSYTDIIKRHDTCLQVYRILRDYRLYNIHPLTNAFSLDRDRLCNIDTYYDMFHYWEYFASQSPLWRERIHDKGGHFNKRCLVLPADDKDTEEEKSGCNDFYDHYGLQPDEQSPRTQTRGFATNESISVSDWVRNVFRGDPIIQIDDPIQYV